MAKKPSAGTILFLFGTQTCGSETLARKFANAAKKYGSQPTVRGMDAFAEIDFTKEHRLALITGTYREGEMPDNAQAFWDHLQSTCPEFAHLEFNMLALGDTNNAKFCKAGELFDARLETLRAKRIFPRVDCDVDFEEPAITDFMVRWTSPGIRRYAERQ